MCRARLLARVPRAILTPSDATAQEVECAASVDLPVEAGDIVVSAAAGKGPVCGLVTAVTAGGRAFILSVDGTLCGEAPTAHSTCAAWAGSSLVVATADGTLATFDGTFHQQSSATLPETAHPVSLCSVGDARLLLFAAGPSSRAASAPYMRAAAGAHEAKVAELLASHSADALFAVTCGAEDEELECDVVAPTLGKDAGDFDDDSATITVRRVQRRGGRLFLPNGRLHVQVVDVGSDGAIAVRATDDAPVAPVALGPTPPAFSTALCEPWCVAFAERRAAASILPHSSPSPCGLAGP